jgi:AraC family transcriptional regulator
VERTLYDCDLFRLGEFRCAPDEPRWRHVNVIHGGPHVVFPLTSAVIQHVGREPVLTNPNHVVFYNAGERYRRTLHDASGDRSLFVDLRHELLRELADGRDEFPFGHGPSAVGSFAIHHSLARRLYAGLVDPLEVEERVLGALRRVVGDGFRFHGMRGGRAATQERHRSLVEDAKALLTTHVSEARPLGFFAHALHTSEFHLARVFRAETGFSLHGYRTQLRLRLALDALAAGREIGELAYDLGFASHSHFTDSFRRVFGVAPSRMG